MFRQILPIGALLAGSGSLLFAGGINSLILPVRGSAEGFSAFSLGLLGTGWAIGYVLGCLNVPHLVARVGHIRAFCVMASLAGMAILLSLLLIFPGAWIVLRGLAGFCFAGVAMIVESWLSERTDPGSRGRIFGIYTMVNLAASTAGQLTLTLGDPNGYVFFVLAAMFYLLALIPPAVTRQASPKPLVSVKLDVRSLWRNSPIAVFAVFMVGMSNSSFGTLAAVYANRVGLPLSAVAFFSSIPILAGAIAQIPVGYLSDRVDRRKVLIGVAVIGLAADIAFVLLSPEGRKLNLILASVFGAAIFAMYPIIVAHANDHAAPGTHIQTSGGLLLVFGIGSIAGPLIAGVGMSQIGTSALFMTTGVAHVLIIGYAIRRITKRAPVERDRKVEFVASPPARASTPETAVFSSRDDQDE